MSDSFVTSWTERCHVPLVMGSTRQEYWGRLPFRSAEDLPNPATESSLLLCRLILYYWATWWTLISVSIKPWPEAELCKRMWIASETSTSRCCRLMARTWFSRTRSIEQKACPRKSYYTSWFFFNNWVYTLDVLHGIPVCMCPHANGRTALDSQCSKFEDQAGNRRSWDLGKKHRIAGSAKVFCHDRVVFYS